MPKAASTQAVDACPVGSVVGLIGGKWKLLILQIMIYQGTKRFGELRRGIAGITQTMLTGQLRALEQDGLVGRRAYPEIPPRVEYSATEKAKALLPVFEAMHAWGSRWVPEHGGSPTGKPQRKTARQAAP